MKEPKISCNLKNLSWVELEELGEMFYELGWDLRKPYDLDDYDALPDHFDHLDGNFPETEEEEFEEGNVKKILN
jgi:hypothetical protein